MASLPEVALHGVRDFKASELIGRRIRIRVEAPYGATIAVDDEYINNVSKMVLTLARDSVHEAILTLCRFDQEKPGEDIPTEEIILRDNIEVSFSATVMEVQ